MPAGIRGVASNEYSLLARLAEGGMAEIFLAQARTIENLERYVVLKRIRPERGADPRWIRMFLDEARLAAQLQHPNIAQVFDLGRIGDAYFFTMEYVHGENLRDVLRSAAARKRKLPLAFALAVASGAAAGLAHAHERRSGDGEPLGIVHRDVSPSNVMISFEGGVKLVDFGVAKATMRLTETQSGTVKGKIGYLSPEQCQGRAVDHRSDIFSLGILLYEACTTRRLWRRPTDYETMTAIVNEDPALPSRLAPGLPSGLDDVILKALAKQPADRYDSCTQLQEAIEDIAERNGISLSSIMVRRCMGELVSYRVEPWREIALTERVTLQSPIAIEATGSESGTPAPGAPMFGVDIDPEDVPLLANLRDKAARFPSASAPPPVTGKSVPDLSNANTIRDTAPAEVCDGFDADDGTDPSDSGADADTEQPREAQPASRPSTAPMPGPRPGMSTMRWGESAPAPLPSLFRRTDSQTKPASPVAARPLAPMTAASSGPLAPITAASSGPLATMAIAPSGGVAPAPPPSSSGQPAVAPVVPQAIAVSPPSGTHQRIVAPSGPFAVAERSHAAARAFGAAEPSHAAARAFGQVEHSQAAARAFGLSSLPMPSPAPPARQRRKRVSRKVFVIALVAGSVAGLAIGQCAIDQGSAASVNRSLPELIEELVDGVTREQRKLAASIAQPGRPIEQLEPSEPEAAQPEPTPQREPPPRAQVAPVSPQTQAPSSRADRRDAEAKPRAPRPPSKPPPRPRLVPPVGPGSGSVVGSGSATVAGKTGSAGEEPPSCSAKQLMKEGEDAGAAGQHAFALGMFEAALRCEPSGALVARAYMAACNARNAAKAKQYFLRLSSEFQDRLQQMCIRNGITVP